MSRPQFSIRTLLWLTAGAALLSLFAGAYLRLNSRLKHFYEIEIRSATQESRPLPWPAGAEGKDWQKWPPEDPAIQQ